ncbi:translation initiation factor IF-3 [bacterium]|nr:translation initiation factor IF-3 [bacterium]
MNKKLRTNRKIISPTIRLIDDKGNQLGIMAIEDAIAKAKNKDTDLVEVSPNSNPPVCKLMDYGKYQYRQKKIDQKHKKMQKQSEVKGIRMGFRTGIHDIEVKKKQAEKFLKARNIVKVALIFRGRELAHINLAKEKLIKFAEELSEIATLEEGPKRQGNNLIMILTPIK